MKAEFDFTVDELKKISEELNDSDLKDIAETERGVILMSIESAKAFIERMKTDAEFARQVASHKDKEERMNFVLAEGFNFSAEDLRQCEAQMTEDELDKVAGGQDDWCGPWWHGEAS